MAKTALLNQIKTSVLGVAAAISTANEKILSGKATKNDLTPVLARIEAVEKAFKAMETHIQGWSNPGLWARIKGNPVALTAARETARQEFVRLKDRYSYLVGAKAPIKKGLDALA